MIYIACAIYKEAKPLIEKYNLKRIDDGKFQIFRNDTVTLIITGSGQTNAAIALTYLLAKMRCTQDDFVVNIGICAGLKEIGKAFFINKITDVATNRSYYPDVFYKHSFEEAEIFSGQTILSEGAYILYDMEAAAIYQAAVKFVSTDRISFIKIVSDNYSPDSVIADVDALVKSIMPQIDEYILLCAKILESEANESTDSQFEFQISQLSNDFHCSVTMENTLLGLLKFAHASRIDVKPILEDMETKEMLPCTNKKEGNQALEYFRKQLL